MDSLEGIPVEKLNEKLEEVEDKRAIKRLMVAILYKQGLTAPEISDIYGFSETTIYRWFKWMRNQPLDEAVYDEKREGRPPKLTEKEQQDLHETLQKPPTEEGYGQQAWTTRLVKHHIQKKYGTNYSKSYIYKIMKRNGLSCKKPRPKHRSADPEEREKFKNKFKKN